MNKIYTIFITFLFLSCDPSTMQNVIKDISSASLTNDDISHGLKQALDLGVAESVHYLSATDGYFKSPYKIFLPEEANTIISKLKSIPGFSNVENELLKLVNRGAEDAAKKAGPVFLSAIKQITFNDALAILTGPDNAATNYLNQKTNVKLYNEFKPIITQSMQKVNANTLWADIINTYNKIPFVDKKNPDLSDHITKQALVGLFSLIADKEKGIRNDVTQRTSDLLKKVFAKQD